jgi:hypothetical protein
MNKEMTQWKEILLAFKEKGNGATKIFVAP